MKREQLYNDYIQYYKDELRGMTRVMIEIISFGLFHFNYYNDLQKSAQYKIIFSHPSSQRLAIRLALAYTESQ